MGKSLVSCFLTHGVLSLGLMYVKNSPVSVLSTKKDAYKRKLVFSFCLTVYIG